MTRRRRTRHAGGVPVAALALAPGFGHGRRGVRAGQGRSSSRCSSTAPGPFAPSGIPSANGFNDYFNLVNERDGGINGVKIVWEECETQYDTKQGVECYERLKGKHGGAVLVNPFSTGITYQLIPKAPVDKVVIHSAGYGMTASADGRWFPWVFNFPMTYWSQASAFVKYVGAQEGGMDKLKGKKIVHIFHNSPYGKEANPTLEDPGQAARLRADAAAGGHPGPGAEGDVAPGAPHQPGLDLHFRLGRDEPGRRQGGGRPSASRWTT